MIDNIRLTGEERQKLINVKRTSGVDNWNILCRWALCLSLAEESDPPRIATAKRGAVEMTWQTFGGDHADVYRALVEAHWTERQPDAEKTEWFYRHLRRGIFRLADLAKSRGSIVTIVQRSCG